VLDAYTAGALASGPQPEAQGAQESCDLEPDEQALLDLLRASEALARTGARAS